MTPIDDIWRYLPVFRAVAEAESVTVAAERLHISPPAVSRTLRLTQEALGVTLLARSGRGLRLTRAGEHLLASVRDAMQRAEDGIALAQGARFSGAMRVSCPASLAASVISALLALKEDHPDFVPDVREPVARPLPMQLLQGSIDLAITAEPPMHDELDVREVYTQQFGVYCGPQHPLFRTEHAPFASLQGQSFVLGSSRGDALDSVWPSEWPRDFSLFASDLAVRLGLCISRAVIAVLPDHAVRDHVKAGRLRRIETPDLPSRVLYAARRREVTPDDALSEAIDSIASALRG